MPEQRTTDFDFPNSKPLEFEEVRKMPYLPTSKSFEIDAFRTKMDTLSIAGRLDYFGIEELTGGQNLTGVLDS